MNQKVLVLRKVHLYQEARVHLSVHLPVNLQALLCLPVYQLPHLLAPQRQQVGAKARLRLLVHQGLPLHLLLRVHLRVRQSHPARVSQDQPVNQYQLVQVHQNLRVNHHQQV